MGLLKADKPQNSEPRILSALIKESFVPQELNVTANEPALGEEPVLTLDLFIGQLAPDLFIQCKSATLTPETAIAVGEHLVKEGRKLRSGLVTGSPGDLANLKRAA